MIWDLDSWMEIDGNCTVVRVNGCLDAVLDRHEIIESDVRPEELILRKLAPLIWLSMPVHDPQLWIKLTTEVSTEGGVYFSPSKTT